MEDSSQAVSVDTVNDLAVTFPSNSALDEEHEQFTDPLAIRFHEIMPRIFPLLSHQGELFLGQTV